MLTNQPQILTNSFLKILKVSVAYFSNFPIFPEFPSFFPDFLVFPGFFTDFPIFPAGQQHWHDHGHEHEHGHGHEQHENQHHQEQLQQQDGQPGSHEQEEIGVFYETFLHYVEFSKFFVSVIFS